VYIGVLYVHALYAFPQYWLTFSIRYLLPPAGEIEENRWTFNDLDWVQGEAYLLLYEKPGVWLSAVPGRVENGFLGGPGLDAAPRVGHDG